MSPIDIPITAADPSLMPFYATPGAAGADIRAYLSEPIEMAPLEIVAIPTGLRLEIPVGYEVQIRPRSGLAFKSGITVLNTPGTIDSDYRGEVKIILINQSSHTFVVEPKMRIAQMIVAPVCQAQFTIKETLAASSRGAGGFGHTGVQ